MRLAAAVAGHAAYESELAFNRALSRQLGEHRASAQHAVEALR